MNDIVKFRMESLKDLKWQYGSGFKDWEFSFKFCKERLFMERVHFGKWMIDDKVQGRHLERIIKRLQKERRMKHAKETNIFSKRNKYKARKEKYKLYLQSPNWKLKRFEIISRHDYICQGCFQKFPHTKLDIHHLTYERFGREKLSDLAPLCRPCHEDVHYKMRMDALDMIDYTPLP